LETHTSKDSREQLTFRKITSLDKAKSKILFIPEYGLLEIGNRDRNRVDTIRMDGWLR
jgi:hypothetical protein